MAQTWCWFNILEDFPYLPSGVLSSSICFPQTAWNFHYYQINPPVPACKGHLVLTWVLKFSMVVSFCYHKYYWWKSQAWSGILYQGEFCWICSNQLWCLMLWLGISWVLSTLKCQPWRSLQTFPLTMVTWWFTERQYWPECLKTLCSLQEAVLLVLSSVPRLLTARASMSSPSVF